MTAKRDPSIPSSGGVYCLWHSTGELAAKSHQKEAQNNNNNRAANQKSWAVVLSPKEAPRRRFESWKREISIGGERISPLPTLFVSASSRSARRLVRGF